MRKKIRKLVFILIILSLVIPFYTYASNTTYVWSEVSSPIVSTASVLSKDER